MKVEFKTRGFLNRKALQVAAFGTLLFWGTPAMAAPVAETGQPEVMEVQQQQEASGIVVDANGEPIIGASIMVKGTSNGTISDVDGHFTLNVAQGATLQISFVGYQTQEVRVTSGKLIRVVLHEDTELLDEIVVVGYGTQKKANLTGAVSTVDVNKTLDAKPQMDVAKALQGVVPGLTVLNTQGGINEQPKLPTSRC